MMARFPSPAATILLVALACGRIANAADDLLPSKQAALLLRVLPFDRNFHKRAADAVTVAVVHREGNPISETYGLDMTAALRDLSRGMRLRGLSVRVISIGYSSSEKFEATLAQQKLAAIYVCPGLVDVFDSISGITRKYKILSFSGRDSEVRDHLSIGLLRHGTRPAILVNLRAATAEGADLEPELLALSEVLR
jgi:hypothetical protein